jgi:hypothetical protein
MSGHRQSTGETISRHVERRPRRGMSSAPKYYCVSIGAIGGFVYGIKQRSSTDQWS